MAAMYATVSYAYQKASGASVTIEAGTTRDSVTDATEIAVWAANWTATAPTGTSHGAKRAGWLSAYPRGTVT
jgi:hypothetical protein